MVFVGNNDPNERSSKIQKLKARNALKQRNIDTKKSSYETALWASDSKGDIALIKNSKGDIALTKPSPSAPPLDNVKERMERMEMAQNDKNVSDNLNASNGIFSRETRAETDIGNENDDITDLHDDSGSRIDESEELRPEIAKWELRDLMAKNPFLSTMDLRPFLKTGRLYTGSPEVTLYGPGKVVIKEGHIDVTNEFETYIDWVKTYGYVDDIYHYVKNSANKPRSAKKALLNIQLKDLADIQERWIQYANATKEMDVDEDQAEMKPAVSHEKYISLIDELFKKYPILIKMRIAPYMVKKSSTDPERQNDKLFIGPKGSLYKTSNDKSSTIDITKIDWPRSYELVYGLGKNYNEKAQEDARASLYELSQNPKFVNKFYSSIFTPEHINGTPMKGYTLMPDSKNKTMTITLANNDRSPVSPVDVLNVNWVDSLSEAEEILGDPSKIATPKKTLRKRLQSMSPASSFVKETKRPNVDSDNSDVKMGRGLLMPKQGMLFGAGVKANRSHHLNDIQGRNSYSTVAYRPLGSKWINLRSLQKNQLKITFNNRSNIGKVIQMSDELTDIIKTLVYDGNIDENAYSKLESEDKEIFTQVLRQTHLDLTRKKMLPSAKELLIAEYNKLRGALALGNNNPATLCELKVLSADLLSLGVIDKKQFKEIQMI